MILMEILGGLVFFGFLGFLSLLILPGLFGIFGFIFLIMLLIGLLVFFSLNFVWIVLFGLAYYVVRHVTKRLRYNKLPNYDDYLTQNVNVYQNGKAVCKYCGSEHLLQQGLFSPRDRSRFYSCLNCRQWLYRFKVL